MFLRSQSERAARSSRGVSPLALFCLLYLLLQLLYVRFGQAAIPITSVSDDRIYLRLGENIARLEAPYTFQYPLLYPLMIALTVPFQGFFGLNAVFAANCLLKVLSFAIVARQLRAFLSEEEALAATALMALSPVSFLYSARVMSENVFVPLLLIALLFHLRRRGVLAGAGTSAAGKPGMTAGAGTSAAGKLGMTAGAAVLAWLLLQTKYLSIVLMPVFCLLWGFGVNGGAAGGRGAASPGSRARRLAKAALWCVIYTVIVLACVVIYAFLLSRKMDTPFTVSWIKKTLGFGVATGPDATGGLRLVPQKKWLFCYGLYALLGAVVPLSAALARADRHAVRRNRAAVIALAAVSVVLIYVSARHSSLAYYNADGHMEKLLGRYVSVATPLMVALYAIACGNGTEGAPAASRRPLRPALAACFAAAVVLTAWLFLYRNIHGWDMAARFLAGNRGLDLIGFSKAGLPSAVLYLAASLAAIFAPGKWPCRISLLACFAWQVAFVFVPG